MTSTHKPILRILLIEEDNYCAKCCKTRQVIERMLEEVPEIKANVQVDYENVPEGHFSNNFADLTPPIIYINEKIYSEGHVPIIKKLSRELLDLL